MRRGRQFKFRLYVAGDAHNSTRALANLNAFCRAHLEHRHQIEVVNVFREPDRALADGIYMTPTLVKVAPAPGQRIVGTLSQKEPLLCALGLDEPQAIAA
jgi:circadian clock protein KaiB